MSLRDKLLPKGSLRERLSELVTGSYEVSKLEGRPEVVVNTRPNIIERLQGERASEFAVNPDDMAKYNDKKYEPFNPEPVKPVSDEKLLKPRKQTLFNKLRAVIEDALDGEDQMAAPVAASNPEPEPTTPESEGKPEQKLETPDVEDKPVETNQQEARERFRQGIVYNENRGTIAAGKDPYQAVGPTGDVGKYQASPATIAAWSKPWLGKKYTVEQFKNDPEAQEKFFEEFLNVKERYGVSDEDAAILWHRGWGVLGFEGTFEEKKQRLDEYLNEIRDDKISTAYRQSFIEGTTTEEN